MLIKTLVPWAGPNFYYEPGQAVELDDATAVARCEAGLAEAAPDELAQARKRLLAPAQRPQRSAA